MKIPDTLAATLQMLPALDAALGPPVAQRPKGTYALEVEAAGEGTFTITAKDGVVTARKGFADGAPLLSATIPKGGWPLIRDELQAAVDGFPHNAELKRRHDALMAMSAAEMDAVLKGVARLKTLGVSVDVKGRGVFALARGALDEVTRTLKITVDGAAIERVLGGGNPDQLGATVAGDRGVGADIAAVLGPVLMRLQSRR